MVRSLLGLFFFTFAIFTMLFKTNMQETLCYALNENLEASSGEGPNLIALANDAGQTGGFTSTSTPSSLCPDNRSISAYQFEDNAGLGFINPNGFIDCAYTAEFLVKFDELPATPLLFDSPWVWVFGTSNDDDGIFIWREILSGGLFLEFWDSNTRLKTVPFSAFNTTDWFQFTILRNCSGQVEVYINCEFFTDFDDNRNILAVQPSTGNQMIFFQDDPEVLQTESSPGLVRNIKISNYAKPSTEILDNCDCLCESVSNNCEIEVSTEMFTCEPSEVGTTIDTIPFAGGCGCSCDSILTYNVILDSDCIADCRTGLDILLPFNGDLSDVSGNQQLVSTQADASVSDDLMLPNDGASLLQLPIDLLDQAQDFSIHFRLLFDQFNIAGTEPLNTIISGFGSAESLNVAYDQQTNAFVVQLMDEAHNFTLPIPLNTETWYCFGLVRAENTITLWLDGEVVNSFTPTSTSALDLLTGGLILGQDQDCLGGCFSMEQGLNGSLDNFRTYKRALAHAEISTFCVKQELEVSICEGDSFLGFNESGSYEINYITANNCDSIEVLQLQVSANPVIEVDTVLCEGTIFAGIGIQRDSTICIESTNEENCLINTCYNITVPLFPANQLSAQLCSGETFTYEDSVFIAPGSYQYSHHSVHGCDSLVEIRLDTIPTYTTIIDTVLCTPNGEDPGIFPDSIACVIFTSSLGCDSTVCIKFRYDAIIQRFITDDLCFGEEYRLGDSIYRESGVYTQSLAAEEGCDTLVELTLVVFQERNVSISGDSLVCAGAPALLEASGGFIDYLWMPDGETGKMLVATEPGEYSVRAIHNTGCVTYDTFTVSIAPPLNLQLSNLINTSCEEIANGEISITVEGGQAPYTYRWSTGDTSRIITELAADSYTLSVTDAIGCQIEETFTLTSTPALSLNLENLVNTSCEEIANGEISITVEGGQAPYTYRWSTGDTSSSVIALQAGSYIVSVTDDIGCQIEEIYVIEEESDLDFSLEYTDPSCNAALDGNISILASGGTGPYLYSVDGQSFQAIPNFPSLAAGNYQIIVEDLNGCRKQQSIDLIDPDPLDISVFPSTTTVVLGESINLVLDTMGLHLTNITWSPTDYLDCSTCPSVMSTPEKDITYQVTVTNDAGCMASASVDIDVMLPPDTLMTPAVFVPNTFSPNGDQLNDRFVVYGNQFVDKINILKIFNRWGQLMFEGENLTPNDEGRGWDGTYNGEFVTNGIYVWFLEVSYTDNRTEIFSGDVLVQH